VQYPAFIGPSGTDRSQVVSCERTINMYLQANDTNSREVALYAFPGLQPVATLPSGPVRGLYEATTGQVYAVTSTHLFEVFSGWTFLQRATIPTGTHPVSMTDDGSFLVLSVEGQGLVYDMTAHTIATIVPGEPTLTFGRLGYIDGRIVTNQPGTRRFWYSDILAPATWDALSYYGAEGRADDILGLIVDHREIWLGGTQSVEVWHSTGDSNDPFARMSGVFVEQGIASGWSLQALDNTIFALGGTPRGEGPIWKFQGYTPTRISNHSFETMLSGSTTIADAIGFTARHGGHAWYFLYLQDTETTWAFDNLLGAWSELAALADDGSLLPFPCYTHCSAFGVHLFGSHSEGVLYIWHPGYHFYGTRPRYCERTGPFIRDDENGSRTPFSTVQLRCLVGQGLDGSPPVGVDPQVRLSWTEDGERWSYAHHRSLGPIGRTERRVTWRQLGMSRERALRFVCTDPVALAFRGCSINGV
jgi:hypothetical protein